MTPPRWDERYTLTEARQIIDQQKCQTHGHSFDYVADRSGNPIMLCCTVCSRNWSVIR